MSEKSVSSNISLSLTPIVTGGVIIAVALVAFIIYKWIKNSDSNKWLRNQSKLISKGNLSYELTDYQNFANKLYNAMKGLGTDEDTIFMVFNQMGNIDDIRQLVNSFGLQGDKTLQQWLLSELSKSDLARVNNILKAKSINYSF